MFYLGVSQAALSQGAYDSATFNTNKAELKVLRITPDGEDTGN